MVKKFPFSANRNRAVSGLVRFLVVSLLVAACACVPAVANPAIQITQCGTVISQPGHYILANDLSCGGPVPTARVVPSSSLLPTAPVILKQAPTGGATDGIDIVADHVDLLLNGHTIAGSSNNTGISVGVGVPSGNSHVHIIGPGTITGFQAAIGFEQVSHSSVSDVTATNNFAGFVAGGGFTTGCALACPSTQDDFQGNTAIQNEASFLLQGANDSTFGDNNASGAFGGIVVFIGTGNDVRENTTSGNQIGILVFAGNGENDITHNTAQNNAMVDLEDDNTNCGSNTWKHNAFGTATQPCIQ
ncbi:MAG TPA: NosD domain-containing protein [Candidatus Angelobacter sp.]